MMDRLGNADGTSAKERSRARKLERKRKAADRGMHSMGRPSSGNRDLLARLVAERGDRCGICHRPLGNLALCNVDHIIPISRGGRHVWSNFQPAHIECNRIKGNRLNFKIGGDLDGKVETS